MGKAIIFIAIAAVAVGAVTGGAVYFMFTKDEEKEDTNALKTTVNYE